VARVFLHIGGPKTGTTFVQSVLWRDPDVARRQGLLLPLASVTDHYRAYLDLTGHANWSGAPGTAAGTWARLLEEIAAHPGDTLLSTEFLVHADASHAARAVRELSALGREVHVVITARDLARFLPSQWQETIKSTRTWSFQEFLRETRDETSADGRAQRRLWDYAAMVATWSQGLPPERIHVVTVPPPSASRSLLWERFCSVVGLDPDAFSLEVRRTNDSLAAPQAEVLRRVNLALAGRLPRPEPYKSTVKRAFARRVLAPRPGPPITIPPADLPWVRDESARLVAALEASGAHIVGELTELLGTPEDPVAPEDVGPTQAQIADEAIAGLAGVLLDVARSRAKQERKVARLRSRLTSPRPQPPGLAHRLARRWRRAGPDSPPTASRIHDTAGHGVGRVFLHIGVPKTGTTFLQAVLWRHRETALEQGLLLPLDGVGDHHRACLDLLGRANRAETPEDVEGAWQRVIDAVAAHPGDALVSHELFSLATAEQAARAITDLAATGHEVHIVLTVRDLARQLPSLWQETVKAARAWTLEEFLQQTRDATGAGHDLHQLQDYAGLVATWSPGVPAEHIHLVTVPPASSPRTLLWERFAAVLGLAADSFSLDVAYTNDSLGAEQVEVLRRVNAELAGRMAWPTPYTATVKRGFGRRVLAPRAGAAIAVPAADLPWVREESAKLVEALGGSGVQVAGDLDDLLVPDTSAAVEGAGLTEEQVSSEAIAAAAELLLAVAEQRERQVAKLARLHRRLAQSGGQR
jgi:hypothetical protein